MKEEYKYVIGLSIIIGIIGITLGMILDFKVSVPFYFTAIITILLEIILLIIFVCKKLNDFENKK